MINANELRISNLFNDADDTPCYFAGGWERKDGWVCRDSGGNVYQQSAMFPISLTLKILERCGFEKTPLFWSKKSCGFEIEVYKEDYNIIHEYTTLTTIHYVHQLQNLYFAITGKELEIKTL